MSSWELTVLILVIIFWCVVRTGRRRALRAHRQLARHRRGRFIAGWTLSRNLVIIPFGDAEVRVRLRCVSWLGGAYAAELNAPWPADRHELALTEPTQLTIPGKRPAGASDQLRETAERLQSNAAVEQVWVRAMRGRFLSRSVLRTAAPEQIIEWFDTTLRLYSLLLAETASGIEFSTARRVPAAGEASCQVCGLPPAETETVYCDRCGAPHHADCWEYNRGCAIYGCK